MNLNTLEKAIDASRRVGKPPRFKEFPEPTRGEGRFSCRRSFTPETFRVVGNTEVRAEQRVVQEG
jgi:hypothetical protein